MLHIAAWYDIFQGGSLRNYIGIKAHGGSEAARKGQHLLVTIGGHAGSGRKIGDVDFGPQPPSSTKTKLTLSWYDYLFKGVQNEFAGKPVKIFVMGANQWREEDDWPLARAQSTKYFLHSHGKSELAARRRQPFDHVASRRKPRITMSTILRIRCRPSAARSAVTRNIWRRVLATSVRSKPATTFWSTPRQRLARTRKSPGRSASNSLPNPRPWIQTLPAKLVDVGPDGFAQNLTEGIIRARYRDSQEKADADESRTGLQVHSISGPPATCFIKGHMLRLEISSSNFPRFDRNLNTGRASLDRTTFVSATNTIYHDAEHPSALILPVVPTP